MLILDKWRLILITMKGRAIVLTLLFGLLLFGIIVGNFAETWRNGATL